MKLRKKKEPDVPVPGCLHRLLILEGRIGNWQDAKTGLWETTVSCVSCGKRFQFHGAVTVDVYGQSEHFL